MTGSVCLTCGMSLPKPGSFCRCFNDPATEGDVIPDGYLFTNAGVCRSCSAPINWTITKDDKRAPLDPDGTSHFATCPSAATHRKDGKA